MVIKELGVGNIQLPGTDNRSPQEVSIVILEDNLIEDGIALGKNGTAIICITVNQRHI